MNFDIFPTNSNDLESSIEGEVQASKSASKLFYLIKSRSGILDSGELTKLRTSLGSMDQWTLPQFQVKKEMKPQCNLIVYYFHPNGEIIFNQKNIQFNEFSTYNVSTFL